MKVVSRFPHRYSETEDCWIPMPDGVRLAAKLWLPDIAAKQRVPTIIEVIPYRKRDIYAPRDAMHHRYFAGHGYATLRVDIRHFQALEELKAVVAQSYAPDRYRYGQVFRGGCVLLRAIRWSSQVFGYKSRPPDPALVDERWREMWMARLEHRMFKVRVPLIDASYSFAQGHRMRVAVSTTYWPLIWPSPEPVALTLRTGKYALVLPVRPTARNGQKAPRFEAPESAPPFRRTALSPVAATAQHGATPAAARRWSRSAIRAGATVTPSSTSSRKRARPSATM